MKRDEERMNSYIDVNKIQIDSNTLDKLRKVCRRSQNHEFDLLGSGYVRIYYGMKAKGAYGHRYVSRVDRILRLISEYRLKNRCGVGYVPINWYMDYKSGYSFDPFRYHSKCTCEKSVGKYAGVDIKCPWELGRLYHLTQLAMLAVFEKESRSQIFREYKDQVFDFIYMNPVGRTVQWSAPMDVSVRIVNLAVSYDILKQLDDEGDLDDRFDRLIEKHLRNSLDYLMENLEFFGRESSNHYLSNIVGIIYASSYLPCSDWSDACLVFGVQELIEQMGRQFHEEGSHFEGSTSYHRLSSEFVLYATALVYGVLGSTRKRAFQQYDSSLVRRLKSCTKQKYDIESDTFFPKWYIDRLLNMGRFTRDVMKQNDEIVQIGDNDSGRLIKLSLLGDIDQDNAINHSGLLSSMGGLFEKSIFEQYVEKLPLEASLIRVLSGAISLKGEKYVQEIRCENNQKYDLNEYAYSEETMLFEDHGRDDLFTGRSVQYFEKFGLLIFRSERVFFSIVIDTTRYTNLIGHTHNDKLSVELMVDGNYIVRDPGGYVYTAAPEIRNIFRGTKAHNTIYVTGTEQNDFNGTFGMKKRARAYLLECTGEKIVVRENYAGLDHIREITFTESKINVKDYANKPFSVDFRNDFYSVGYGKMRGKINYDSK